MTVLLTPEQEQRIQAIIETGAYGTVGDVVEAALSAVELTAHPDFDGTEGELEEMLVQGLDAPRLSEADFWRDVNHATDAMLADYRASARS